MTSFALGWDGGLTMRGGPKEDREAWTWSYRDDFLPLLRAACPPHGIRRFLDSLGAPPGDE